MILMFSLHSQTRSCILTAKAGDLGGMNGAVSVLYVMFCKLLICIHGIAHILFHTQSDCGGCLCYMVYSFHIYGEFRRIHIPSLTNCVSYVIFVTSS